MRAAGTGWHKVRAGQAATCKVPQAPPKVRATLYSRRHRPPQEQVRSGGRRHGGPQSRPRHPGPRDRHAGHSARSLRPHSAPRSMLHVSLLCHQRRRSGRGESQGPDLLQPGSRLSPGSANSFKLLGLCPEATSSSPSAGTRPGSPVLCFPCSRTVS